MKRETNESGTGGIGDFGGRKMEKGNCKGEHVMGGRES